MKNDPQKRKTPTALDQQVAAIAADYFAQYPNYEQIEIYRSGYVQLRRRLADRVSHPQHGSPLYIVRQGRIPQCC